MHVFKEEGVGGGEGGIACLVALPDRHLQDGHEVSAAASTLSLHAKKDKVSNTSNLYPIHHRGIHMHV